MALAQLFAGLIDENATHGFRCRSKEVDPILPALILIAREFQPCFVYQGRALQGLNRRLLGHLCMRQASEFLINQGKQLLRRSLVAGLGLRQ